MVRRSVAGWSQPLGLLGFGRRHVFFNSLLRLEHEVGGNRTEIYQPLGPEIDQPL